MVSSGLVRAARALRPVLAFGLPLILLTTLGVRAQTVHTHAWAAVHDVPTPSVYTTTDSVGMNQIISVGASGGYYGEGDLCTEYGTGMDDQCRFYSNTAFNAIQTTGWSDGGAGGAFGYLDEVGQFVSTTDAGLITHYRSPGTPGPVTLTVTVDDIPEATEPETGSVIATFNDNPASGTKTLQVSAPDPHSHYWQPNNDIPYPTLNVGSFRPAPGQVISVTAAVRNDTDECYTYEGYPYGSGQEPCPFPGKVAENAVQAISWSDNGSGGAFGYVDGAGQFVATTDPLLVTHYRCPATSGDVGLYVTVDDIPEAIEPGTTNLIPTFDDGSVYAYAHFNVEGVDIHDHDWEAVSDIPAPAIVSDTDVAEGNEVISLWVESVADDDLCIDPSIDPCAFPNYLAPNALQVAGWDDGGAGGTFGYLDANGQFGAASAADQVTHYRFPPSFTTVRITATVDDIPWATELSTGYTVPTYNDANRSAYRDYGYRPGTHTHQWSQGQPISRPTVMPETDYPAKSQVISIGDSSYGYGDLDQCTTASTPCPMNYWVTNAVYRKSWSDNGAGGAFGYLDGYGQFVVSTDAVQITHYRCPDHDGDVTLRLTVDDNPQIQDGMGQPVTTYNDPEVWDDHVIHVGGAHPHDWDPVHNISEPYVGTSTDSPTTNQVISVWASPGGDSDYCRRYQPPCSFYYNTASNPVQLTGWSDNGGGGAFGYLNGGVFFPSSDPAVITHYRCPNTPKSVRLTATTDDTPQAINMAGEQEATFNDNPATGSRTITIEPGHIHNFVSTGNQADQAVWLHSQGSNVTAACVGDVVEIAKGGISPDSDQCDRPGCCFAPDGTGKFTVVETLAKHKSVRYADDCGGRFGKLTADGTDFIELSPSQVDQITHYAVGSNVSPGGEAHVWMVVDDAGEAQDCLASQAVSTVNDSQKDGTKYAFTISTTGCLPLNIRDKPILSEDDVCGCNCEEVPALSSISPKTGAVSFDVPVTSWTYRGMELGLSLGYSSGSKADPTLDDPELPGINPSPDLAHMSQRNSHWTHNWAQFVQVVQDASGEVHALWNAGGGGMSFKLIQDPMTQQLRWVPKDSYHSMVSGGSASTDVKVKAPRSGSCSVLASTLIGQAQIKFRIVKFFVPYSWFEVTDGAGTRYHFDLLYWQSGWGVAIPYFPLTWVQDRWGRRVNLTWVKGQLTEVRGEGDARALKFGYAGGLLRTVTDPDNRLHRLNYSIYNDEGGRARNKLTGVQVEGVGSPRTRYQWLFDYGTPADAQQYYGGSYTGDLIIRKTEPTGKLVHYEYEGVNTSREGFNDWDGRIRRAWHLDSTEASTTYPHGRLKQFLREGTSIVFPQGNRVTYHYQGEDLESVEDASTGRRVRYTYDTWHNLTSIRTDREPGDGPTYETVTAASRALVSVRYTYLPDNRTINIAESWDAEGNYSRTIFSALNLPTAHTAFARPTSGFRDQTTKFLYNSYGNATAITQAFNTPSALTSTLGYASATAPDSPTSLTDPLGRVWQTGYDPHGRPTASTSPSNLDGIDTAPSLSRLYYNAEGLPAQAVDPLGHSASTVYTVHPQNQSWLQVTQTEAGTSEQVVLDAAGNPIRAVDAASVVTEARYNGDGLPLWVKEAAGRPEERITRYEYDLNGSLLRLITPKGHAVRFDYRRYDRTGNLVGGEQNPIYEGQVTRITHADNTEEYFGYDAAGNLEWVSRPYKTAFQTLWSTTEYTRDALHRVSQVAYPPSPDGTAGFTVTFDYDEFGRMWRVSDNTGTTTYGFDDLNRVVSIDPSGNRKGVIVQYLADLTKRRWITQVTLQGEPVPYQYFEDTKGRLRKVRNPFNQEFVTDYDLDGKPLAQRYANGTSTQYAYEVGRDRLTGVTHKLANQSILDQFTYQYHPDGRLWKETDAGNRVHEFLYDGLGQLIEERHPDLGSGILYEYDKNGNRSWVRRNGQWEYYKVDQADRLLWTNRVASRTQNPVAPTLGQQAPYSLYTYDDFGQLRSRARREPGGSDHRLDFRWDTAGRLRSVLRQNSEVFRATYAADGERVTKWDSQTGNHVYSFGLHDTDGNTVHTPGLSFRKGNGTERTFHGDWLGSTRYLTGGGGNGAPAAMRFDAYGQRTARAGQDGGYPTEFQYAGAWGYEREPAGDADLGLDYLYQRYYDPAAGRFISRDPIGWAGGLNLYGYCFNNPVELVDPSGLDALDDASNFFAGWGDTLTWGGTRWVRQRLGVDDVVNTGSGWYTGGHVVGTVHQIALTRDASKLAIGKYAFHYMTPFKRGRLLERLLGAQRNLRANFPVIDRFSRGVATSIKSLDLHAKSYQKTCRLKSVIEKYIDALDDFVGHGRIRPGMIRSKRLLLALPRGASKAQHEALRELADYARERNISLVIEWF